MKATDKNKLIDRIKSIEGLTDDERAALLGLLNETKTYGLVWEDKPEEVEERLRSELPVLKEVKSRAIISDNADAPNHILIEGDNLEALTTLAYTHEDTIDVIYIDPPYNTRKKDFKYNDTYIDPDDDFSHSTWLSFMSKRIRIAKRLLNDKGVIFIQIDDREYAPLKLLCDSIFGENNFIGPFIQNKLNAKNDTLNVQRNHEYILCYRKRAIYEDIENGKNKILPSLVHKEIRERIVTEENGKFYFLNDSITTRGEGGTLNARPNLGYTFYFNPITKQLIPQSDYNIEKAKTSNSITEIYTTDEALVEQGFVVIRPPMVRGKLGCWTWDINKAKRDIGLLVVKETKNRFNIHKRTFVPSHQVINRSGTFIYREETAANCKSIIEYSTNEGTDTFTSIMGYETGFNNPKNVSMLKYLLSLIPQSDITILDFFAGSGTTLHATLELNSEDEGRRKCILCTNNENSICEKITYPRVQKIIKGYISNDGISKDGLKDNTLRYYRTDFVGRRRTPQNMRRLMLLSSDMLCIKENLYTEHDMFGDMPTLESGFRYFADGKKQMLIVYNEEAIYDLIDAIEDMDVQTPIIVYVFSPGNDAWNVEFESVNEKVRLTALPAAIYNAYKRVLPKPKNTLLNPEEEVKEVINKEAENLFDFEEEGGEE